MPNLRRPRRAAARAVPLTAAQRARLTLHHDRVAELERQVREAHAQRAQFVDAILLGVAPAEELAQLEVHDAGPAGLELRPKAPADSTGGA